MSRLKWTIVASPCSPTAGPKTASINVRNVGDKGGIRLSRANAAAYYFLQLAHSHRCTGSSVEQ